MDLHLCRNSGKTSMEMMHTQCRVVLTPDPDPRGGAGKRAAGSPGPIALREHEVGKKYSCILP